MSKSASISDLQNLREKSKLVLIYDETEVLFESFQKRSYYKENLELSQITYTKEEGFNIININPLYCGILIMERAIVYLLNGYINIIKQVIGYELALNLFAKVDIYNYLFNNMQFLHDLNLDLLMLRLFLIE